MANWRPSGWDAQQIAKEAGEIGNDEQRGLIEIGADAMLEALRKSGKHYESNDFIRDEFGVEVKGGATCVIIPDDVEEK